MARKYFGTDGVRGTIGQAPMTPDFVLKLGWAAGKVLAGNGHPLVLIGKDPRISGYMLESALQAGLAAAGVNVRLLGPMPTPAIAYLTRAFRAAAGIVISASHNPYHDNGVKFFSADGMKLPDEVEEEIEAYLDQPLVTVASNDLGKAVRINDAAGRYIEFCKRAFPTELSLKGLRVVVDCANGATYHVAPDVFSELGAEVITIANEPNGFNINDHCGATDTAILRETVLKYRADIGLALDGDGDRLIMVDHMGEVVDGDEALAVIAQERGRDYLQAGVVGTQMSNLGLEKAVTRLGLPFYRAKVGDRYVMELMLKHQCLLGGESSGHVIVREHISTGDGIVAGLQVLRAMLYSGKSLHDLKKIMRKYPQKLVNVPIKQRINLDESVQIQDAVKQAEAELGERGRVLLRASGTEPLIRVMVEGEDSGETKRLAEAIAEVVRHAA